jgi:predicted MFS family arabinose efflux permease
MLSVCATTSALVPVLAVLLSKFGWIMLLPLFFLAGATFEGRKVGFSSALLELAPTAERPTYAGLNAVLILPISFLPLLAGLFLEQWSYTALYLLASAFIAAGAMVAWWWLRQSVEEHLDADDEINIVGQPEVRVVEQ